MDQGGQYGTYADGADERATLTPEGYEAIRDVEDGHRYAVAPGALTLP